MQKNIMQGFQTIDPKFRSYYYKRLFSYYWLEIKTYFLNPINYLTMAALIVLGSIISLFAFVSFFNFATFGFTNSTKTISSAVNGKTITLFVTTFAAITGYRLFFVASTTLFNSSRLKQAYLYFHEKHVLRAQALREFASSFVILFFYLLMLLFLLRVIPNSAGGAAAKYNFLTHVGGNRGLGAQFLFDFFAIIAISAVYTTFFITAQYFARLTKSRNSLNLVFAAAGVLFWFFFFLPSFFALAQIKHLGFMGHIPNWTWFIPVLNWFNFSTQPLYVSDVSEFYNSINKILPPGVQPTLDASNSNLNVLNLWNMSGYIWILILYTFLMNEVMTHFFAFPIKATNSNK